MVKAGEEEIPQPQTKAEYEAYVEDKIISWEEWEKIPNQAIIASISRAIGELERRGITESENTQLVTVGVLIEKLCLKRTVED